MKEIEVRVAEVRGLEPLAEVEYAFPSRESMSRLVDESLRDGMHSSLETFDILFERQPVYQLLGFISTEDNLLELRARFTASVAAGFYCPPVKAVFLIDGDQGLDASTDLTVAHEFVHALQDQHFGLDQLAARTRDDWDATLAQAALREGDATVAMEDYARMSTELAASPAVDAEERAARRIEGVPEALQKEFAFPYEAGVGFVEVLLANGGWAAVNDAYRQPPATTEQVIHPEKYLAGETAMEITLVPMASALGEAWSRVADNVMGEFLLRMHLGTRLDPSEAETAAAGWGGDRWFLYTDDEDGNLLHLVVEWDTAAELDEFYAAYLKWLKLASDGASVVLSEDAALWEREPHSVYVSRRDGRATILISSDPSALEHAREALGLR